MYYDVMKILFDARESGTSTGRYMDKLVEYLYKEDPGLKLEVLTRKNRLDYIRSIAPGYGVMEAEFKEFTFDEQLGFKKLIKSRNPDLVHFGMIQQPILYRGKVVTTMHDLTTARFTNPDKNPVVFKIKQVVYKVVIRVAAKKSVKIITPTQYVKDDLVDFAKISPDKVVVTPESADKISDPALEMPGLKGRRFIMYIGRPTPHKNLERLIDAFAEILETQPDLKLVLAGKKDANYSRIEDGVEPKLKDSIVFTDFISEGQLRWLYENCQAYVFPSLSEGFGLPGLEAMIHGAPVVSSNATCLPEVYGDAAAYFDPLDTESMASTINKVLTDAAYRNTLIAKGHAQAAKYSWRRMAQQTLSVYKEVLGK